MRRVLLIGPLFSVLSVCCAVAETVPVGCRVASEFSGYAETGAQLFSNPAMKSFQRNYSVSEARIGYESERQTRAVNSFYGEGMRQGSFDARAYIHSGQSTVWGSAGYHNGKILDCRLCESPDYDMVYPYVLADTVGGDQKMEKYRFSGGYAYRGRNLSWGVSVGYDAGLYYRQVDPRPKSITGRLDVSAGIAFRAGGYMIGPALFFRRYRQTTDISFVSEMGESKLFHLTGLGTHYSRFDGSGSSVFSDCYDYGAGVDLCPSSGTGFFGSARMSVMTMRHVISDLNKLPMANVNHKSLGAQGGYMYDRGGKWRWKAFMDFGVWRRHGTENLFGDPTSGSYPQIGSRLAFADNHWSTGIGAMAEFSVSRWKIGINGSLMFDHRLMAYSRPHSEWMADHINASLSPFAFCSLSDKWQAGLRAEVMLRDSPASRLSLSAAENDRADRIFKDAVAEDFRNDTCPFECFGAGMVVSYAINEKYAVDFEAHFRHSRYSSGIKADEAVMSVGFVF